MRTLNPLQHANNSTNPVNISVYIWASEVKLSAPTSSNVYSITAQSGEYDKSVLSKTLSKVADTSQILTKVPIIAPYATATQAVAGALGETAKMFGFSRPIDIREPEKVQPQYSNNLSSTDTRDTSNKITVDSKQELSVDSRITGLSGKDELVITDIASKESYLDTFTWTINTPIATTLFTGRVTPQVYHIGTNGVWMPACAFVTMPFQFWRGDVTYRFEIVATPFHRGRILVVYDPLFVSPTLEANTMQTQVVDIATQKDFSITLGWAQNKTFLETHPMTTSPTTSDYHIDGTTFTTSSEYANGVISLHVLNTLTVANETAPDNVEINVYVSCNDIEVAVPTSKNISNLAYVAQSSEYVAQSGEVVEDEMIVDSNKPENENVITTMSVPIPQSDNIYDVYMGEKIVSFRPLLKRYTLNEAHVIKTQTTPVLTKIRKSNAPMFMGTWNMSPYVTDIVQGTSNLFTYLVPGFLQIRGAMRHKYMFQTDTTFDIHTFVQKSHQSATSFWRHDDVTLDTTDNDQMQWHYFDVVRSGVGGTIYAPKTVQPILEIEMPFQEQYRFDCARCIDYNVGEDPSYRFTRHAHNLFVNHFKLDVFYLNFFAVGEDFNLSLFQGAPFIGYQPTVVP